MPTIDQPRYLAAATLTFVEYDKLEIHLPTTCVRPMSIACGYIDPSFLSIRQTYFSEFEQPITDCAFLQRSNSNKPSAVRSEPNIVDQWSEVAFSRLEAANWIMGKKRLG